MTESVREDPSGTADDARTKKKRILIISDTHGYSREVEPLFRKIRQADFLIHCGDVYGDEDYIRACAAEILGCPCSIVQGNNDLWTDLPQEEIMTIAGHKILVCHGHRYGISYDTSSLKKHAKSKGAAIVCCGHTHVPMIDTRDPEILLINPGSLSLPRQSGRESSYAMMELDETGFRYAWINYLPGAGRGFGRGRYRV
ncbi:MAG: metallophosphoesterase [Lachnospiraceae bacterium]|nr:metallophosphoesterase [Lachnospiraceae bacterium]